MKNKKFILIFVLAATMIAGALVFDGVSHWRVANENLAMMQSAVATTTTTASVMPAIPKPDAGTPADTSTGGAIDSENPEEQAADSDPQNQNDKTANGDFANADANVNAIVVRRTATRHGTFATVVSAANDNPHNPLPQSDGSQGGVAANSTPVVAASAIVSAVTSSASKHALIVPAGVIFAVRLTEGLASDTSEAGQTFSATLDRDITVNGKTAIASGAVVTGKVALARPVGAITGEPELELRLVSVNVNNADVPVTTAIRSFGPKIKGKNKVSRFMKGLLKRYENKEEEVVLDDQSSYSFTLRQPLQIRQ